MLSAHKTHQFQYSRSSLLLYCAYIKIVSSTLLAGKHITHIKPHKCSNSCSPSPWKNSIKKNQKL